MQLYCNKLRIDFTEMNINNISNFTFLALKAKELHKRQYIELKYNVRTTSIYCSTVYSVAGYTHMFTVLSVKITNLKCCMDQPCYCPSF